MSSDQVFDYVIAGAGAAGCVLAYRLSENPANRVALIEAGGSDKNLFIQMPKGLAKAMTDPARLFVYAAAPEKGNAFRPEFWARGRLMGGSSSVNGMMYVRGQPADFDEIAAVSSDDWAWKHIGPAYKALEGHELGEGETRGGGGPLRVTLADRKSALTEGIIAACAAMGLQPRQDVNAPQGDETVGYASRTIYKGVRQSAATAFIDPIRGKRANLTILTGALVDRVVFEGRRATGLRVLEGAAKAPRVVAGRQIILCGGAMASPGILQRSGIGPAALLRGLGIAPLVDSPDVGRKLLEHRGIMMQWRLKPEYAALSENRAFSGPRLLANVLRYLLFKAGPMGSAAYELGAWLRSGAGASRPDVQFLLAPFSFDFESGRTRLENFPGFHLVGYPLRPVSHGTVNIRSANPEEMPELHPNYYTQGEDRALMVATVKLGRRMAEQGALKRFIAAETYPGPQAQSDEEIIAAYDLYGSCGYHAVGSCRMGNDEASVVDPQLRVRGVEGLRVLDTSIMPQIPAGNTNGPTMVMAWRGADIILRGA